MNTFADAVLTIRYQYRDKWIRNNASLSGDIVDIGIKLCFRINWITNWVDAADVVWTFRTSSSNFQWWFSFPPSVPVLFLLALNKVSWTLSCLFIDLFIYLTLLYKPMSRDAYRVRRSAFEYGDVIFLPTRWPLRSSFIILIAPMPISVSFQTQDESSVSSDHKSQE